MISVALCVLLAVGSYAAGPCSQARDEYQKTGMVGKMFSCDDDGFYSQIQCTGSVCHCSDAVGRMLGSAQDTFSIGDYTANKNKCATLAQKRPCNKARSDYQKTGMVGKFFYCDADGFFSQIQCLGSVCHCSDAVGTMLGATQDTFSIGESAANKDKCASLAEERPCNKDRADYQKKGLLGLQFRCDADGFYELIQCRGSGCYCVNLQGTVLKGGEFSIGELGHPELLSKRQQQCDILEKSDFWSSG